MFYKLDSQILLCGSYITGTDYAIFESNKNEYNYPVDGWYWFDTEDEAYTFFNLEKP